MDYNSQLCYGIKKWYYVHNKNLTKYLEGTMWTAVPDWAGYLLVLVSSLPMAWAEGTLIGMRFQYRILQTLPVLVVYQLGVVLYMVGLMSLADKIGRVIGIWEISAILLAVFVAVKESGRPFPVDLGMIFHVLLLLLSVLLLVYASEYIFSRVEL